jgi:hypothetical protein
MAIKQISLITGSYDLDFIPAPHSAAQDDRTDFEELGATGKVQRNRSSGVTHGMGGAILPNTLSLPSKRTTRARRKSGAVRLRELQTLVPFPASTLRRMTRDGIRKWHRGAIEQWLICPQPEVGWSASDAYGTAHDPAPEIRSHMRAILGGSAKPTARARA